MEVTGWSSPAVVLGAAVATVGLALLLKLAFLRPARKLNLPPGPKPWPIIGNLRLNGTIPIRSIHALVAVYGPLMRLRFGVLNVVVASSAEMAREFLKTHDLNFANRPRTAAGKYTTYNYSDISWPSYGSYWRQTRRICAVELFNPGRLDALEPVRAEEVRLFLERLFSSSGAVVKLKDQLTTLNLHLISRVLFGRKYADEFDPLTMRETLDEFFFLNGVVNIGDVIPWLAPLDLQGYEKRMKAVGKKMDRFMEHAVEDHRERRRREGAERSSRNIVDAVLQCADDPNFEIEFTGEQVKGALQDLVTGGIETSATTIEWATTELLRHPHVMDKAVEELDRVVGGGRWVTEKDGERLPYLSCIVKETMRLHPAVPMLIPHLSKDDCNVAGYDIPGGTMLLVNAWSIGRDPRSWDSPLDFRPERFLGKDIDVVGKNYELLPFGSGRRMCPGYSLGLKMVRLTLANLLHGFNLKLPEGVSPEKMDMEEALGLTASKKVPLGVVAEPRLPEYMYRLG